MVDVKHGPDSVPEVDAQSEARLATVDSLVTGETGVQDEVVAAPSWLLPSGVYAVLKWVVLTVMPALAVLVGALGAVWGLPHLDAVVTTINAIALFLGALIGVSAATVKK